MPRKLIEEPISSLDNRLSISQKRRLALRDTIEKFNLDRELGQFEKIARNNHQRWKSIENPIVGRVKVISGDWGEVTLTLSKDTGHVYAVLNMANADIPGGGYLEGFGAQEENMYFRTNCHFYVRDNEMDETKSRYKKYMTDLINGKSGKVYLDKDNPRICIKGSEGKDASGYLDLPKSDFFLFYELKAAADNIFDESHFNEPLMRKKVSAQLDTLIENNVRYVVLSAFGCGAFGNPSHEVARIYKEELEKRPGYFDDVVFAIYDSEYGPDNYNPFRQHLHGLPLNTIEIERQAKLIEALNEYVHKNEWEKGFSLFIFNFNKPDPIIGQLREVLTSDLEDLNKLRRLKDFATSKLMNPTVSASYNQDVKVLLEKIMSINIADITEDIVGQFKDIHNDNTPKL